MTNSDINYLLLRTVPLVMKMLKSGEVSFVVEPLLDEVKEVNS
jgi:hypothetical protein